MAGAAGPTALKEHHQPPLQCSVDVVSRHATAAILIDEVRQLDANHAMALLLRTANACNVLVCPEKNTNELELELYIYEAFRLS